MAVASVVVAEQGAEASLEEIARRAGVGSATPHRHFPSRLALLDAVRNRGLARSLLRGSESSHARIPATAEELLARAQQARKVRQYVATGELLKLANGVALAAGEDEDLADRLLSMAVNGIGR